MHSKGKWWAGAAVATGVASVLLLAPIDLGATRLTNAIEDAAHGPLFGAVAIGILLSLRRLLPRATSLSVYVLAWFIAVMLGAATEFAQSFTGNRLTTLRDLYSDAYGAFAGLAGFAAFDSTLRLRAVSRTILILLGAAALAKVLLPILDASMEVRQRRAQLPELLRWDTPLGYRSVGVYDATGMTASVPAEWRRHEGERAYYVYPFAPSPGATQAAPSWPGVTLDEPWPEWSRYRELVLDIVNPNDSELSLTLRVNDWAHDHSYGDRFNRSLTIAPRQRVQIAIPLAEIAAAPARRSMDMNAIVKLILFQEGRLGALPFYLCGARFTE